MKFLTYVLGLTILCPMLLVGDTIFYDSGDPPQGVGPDLFSDEWIAQSFTATGAWQMGMLGVFASGSQPITMILAQDASGLPSTPLATWTTDKTDWDPGGSWGNTPAVFSFTQGATYWFEYTSSADIFSGDLLPTPAPNGNSDIAFSFDQGQSWSIAPGAGPLGFRIESAPISSVPEPSTIYLVGGALLAISVLRRGCSA